MQPGGQNPVRPVALQGSSDLQQLFDIVRAQQQQQQQQQQQPRSAFSQLPQQQLIPEFNLYHAAHLSGLLGNNLPQPQMPHPEGNLLPVEGPARAQAAASRPASRSEKSSTAYASRHQAAEQRRRNRINDRLDLLRKVVPHSERANTATFLEEVIKYVGELQTRIAALETAQGLPLSCPNRQGVGQALHQLSQPSQKILSVAADGQTASQSAPVMSNFSQPLSIFPDSIINTSNAAQSTLQVQKSRPDTPSQSSGEVEGGAKAKPASDDSPVPPSKRARSGQEPAA